MRNRKQQLQNKNGDKSRRDIYLLEVRIFLIFNKIKMSCIKNNNKHLAYKEYEPPTKKITSEGDILIKELANKQQKKNINLQEYLEKEQSFEKHSEQISFTSCCSGTLPLEQFKIALQQLDQIEDLKAYNLTNDDVKLMLDYRDGKIYDKYRNIEPSILQMKIQKILEIIAEYNNSHKDCDNKSRNISHKQNEALALKPDSIETKLFKFALENKNDISQKLPHPMDNIRDLENNMFSHLYEKKLIPSKIKKQIRRYANKINTSTASIGSSSSDLIKNENPSFVNHSKWDQREIEATSTISVNTTPKKYTCKRQNYYTVRNGEIVQLTQNDSVKRLEIETINRLSIEEIKAIPKFKDYIAGSPSKTLYLKNLPKNIKEKDLQDIFAAYTSTNTLFKIMNGKMKGQAFVTFPDIDIASKALDATNGTYVNGKPIIIQFGKK